MAGDVGIVRPIFDPGDALLFDHLFLHQTGSDPSMPNPRYADRELVLRVRRRSPASTLPLAF